MESVIQEKMTAPKSEGRKIQSGLTPYSGSWDRAAVIHFLKRTMFGAATEDIQYFSGISLQQAVDEMLTPSNIYPNPPVNDYHATTADPYVAAGQTWVNNYILDGTINSLRTASFKKWWAGVMIRQDRSIREKLTLFWANHWGTETKGIFISHYIYKHHDKLRRGCLGNFKTMVKQITVDPGMLIYLNNNLNTKNAPDENYAREIQELFTVGKHPISNLAEFTEDDVKAAARILTGWRVDNTYYTGVFFPTLHDTTDKSFSSFYNNTVITGKTGSNGATETNELIDMLFAKEETSKHIVRKLYRWFVYYKIDNYTEQQIIAPLAEIFRQNNYEIIPVLRALFLSEHFFDQQNRGCYIKSPADLVIGHLREFNVEFPATSDYTTNYGLYAFAWYMMSLMSQDIGDPPNVSGWPAFYQEPMFHEIWISHDTLPRRNQFTDYLVSTGYTFNNTLLKTDPVEFAKTLTNPEDPNLLISGMVELLLGVSLTTSSALQLKTNFLLSGQSADYYWTDAWNAYMSNPSTTNYNTVSTRLKNLLKYLLELAEYQLC